MRPQASEEKRSMDYFAGLDVSVKETSVCILDDAGRIVKEVKVASEPQALLKVLGNPTYRFKRIGLEAGPLSQWLFSALAEAELPVICVPRCRPRGGADLSRHRRRASPIPKIQVGRGGVWADVLQVSIRRDRLEWQDIALRG
jgi:hypothetical protein